jgi:hypothetical protein
MAGQDDQSVAIWHQTTTAVRDKPSNRYDANWGQSTMGIKSVTIRNSYWWMAGTSIVQRALDNQWLTEQGVPSLRQRWIDMHYGKQNEQFNPQAINPTGIG